MWVYVRFLQDDEFHIVEETKIKKFDRENVKYNQKYYVQWKNNEYYQAQIIYVKESLEELNKAIEARRVKVLSKQLLNSGDDESSCSEDDGGTRQKNLKKKGVDLQKIAIQNSKKKNELNILSKHVIEKESDNLNALDQKIGELEKAEFKIVKLEKEIDSLKKKCLELENLNISLQRDVIDIHKDLVNKLQNQEAKSKDDHENVPVGQLIGDEVHIGQNIFLKKTTYNSCIVSARSGAQFVKNIAVAIFGIEELKKSSVTGKKSNRIKKHITRPPLDPTKLQAIRDIYKHYLLQKGQAEVAIDYDLSKIGLYLASKISDLNRLSKGKKSSANDNVDETDITDLQDADSLESNDSNNNANAIQDNIEDSLSLLSEYDYV